MSKASTATVDFAAYQERRDAERAARDAAAISWRKAILPGSNPGDPKGYVARNGEIRAYVRFARIEGGTGFYYKIGYLIDAQLQPTNTVEPTLARAKIRAFGLVNQKKEEEMSTAVAEPKTGSKKSVDTGALREALVEAILEAIPGAKHSWNKTKRYETFTLDGKSFGLVFKAGAKTVPVKIPSQLRETTLAPTSGFKKSEYGLARSLAKKTDVKTVAKAFAAAAAAAAATKPAE